MAEFKYQEPFPIENDTTVYRLLTKDYVKTIECEGRRTGATAQRAVEESNAGVWNSVRTEVD